MLSPEEIKKIAYLARISLTEEEIKSQGVQLNNILEFFHKLEEVDTDSVEGATHVIPMVNVFRNDENEPSFTPEQSLTNAPESVGDYFKVPRIIE